MTPQEHQVALLVGAGLSDRLIAERLKLAPSTVATYVQRIRDRLDLAGRRDIAARVTVGRHPARPEACLCRAAGGDRA